MYAPWADAGMDAPLSGDLERDGGHDPDLDASRPTRPDAGRTDRACRAEEVCGNGVDDDCTGEVEDGCPCEAGTSQVCFGGDPAHRGLGLCADGAMACEGTEFGVWTSCTGDVLEAPEVCDEAGLDEDCDGVSNEGCECAGDGALPCGTDEGECMAGVQRCVDGMRTGCEGATGPRGERCDGLDEDCDGAIDEGVTRRCGFDRGICVSGVEACASGEFGECEGAVLPVAEVCNGLDDDCDTRTDESVTRACGTDVGACVAGTETCAGGRFGACAGATSPIDEVCNGADDDCDGSTDEGLVRGCGTDVGECVAGRETCRGGAYSACEGSVGPTREACDGARDENCDGAASPFGTVTMVGQNYFRPPSALAAGGPPPGTSHAITVRACRTSDPTCCASAPSPLLVRLVEECTTPIAASSSNTIFSEYIIDGDESELGEAIEITNLSHCPVTLSGTHFSYCNGTCASTAYRWMNFGAGEVVPPRGVYVAVRDRAGSTCSFPFLGADDPSLFGLRVSVLTMEGLNIASGWFNNSGGAMSQLRLATGMWPGTIGGGTTLDVISPYRLYSPSSAAACNAIGYDALDACGEVTAAGNPTSQLSPNQLGRLWHPCDAVVSPVPAACR
ncbi:MAG: MopE-related protein [Deltaproteobacteria bacterium]